MNNLIEHQNNKNMLCFSKGREIQITANQNSPLQVLKDINDGGKMMK
jgi:hypothetical protein